MSIVQKSFSIKSQPSSVSKNLIIFSHIPKTAGSTINDIIDSNYHHIFNFYPRRNPKSTKLKDWVNDFKIGMETLNEDTSPKLLRGHFGMGIHDLLGVDYCNYITVLRDPIDRVISHYYFLEQVENFFEVTQSDSHSFAENMTLEKFVYQRKDILVDNLQTRFISGLGWQRSLYKNVWQEFYNLNFRVPYGDCTDAMLSCAKENLKNHIIFGIQNRFNESLELFKNVLGWQTVNFSTKKNVNKKKPKREELDPNLINFIERENYLDVELYKYALEIFDEQLEKLPSSNKTITNNSSWSYPTILQQKNNIDMKAQLKEVSQIQLQEADELLKTGDYTQAINKYKEVVQANPEYIPALQKLANSYIQNNAEEKAIIVYEHIIKLNSNQDKAYARLGKIQAKQGNYNSAIANFKKAISLKSDQPDWVFTGLGDALKKKKKLAV